MNILKPSIDKIEEPPKCACGCGGIVKVSKNCKFKWNKFIDGHNVNVLNRNNPRGDIHGNRNPNWKGGRRTDKDGYILIKDMNHPFRTRKNLVYEHRVVMENYLRVVNPQHISLIEINGMLYIKPEYVIKHIDKNPSNNKIENLRIILHSQHMSEENKGVKRDFTEEHLVNMRKAISERDTFGEKNPHWMGGISFEPYSSEFNDRLKSTIRKRDKFICQECGISENELGHALSIHHIDYNKKNNDINNLIGLCGSCHAKTSWKRDSWICYYKQKVVDKND